MYTVTECSVKDIIDHNQVPTLMIVGPLDKRFEPYRAFAEKTIPRLETLILDGGHAINIDDAETFNKSVRAFVLRER